MKNFFLLPFFFIIFSISPIFAISENTLLYDIGNHITLVQKDKQSLLQFWWKIIKIFPNESALLPFVWDEWCELLTKKFQGIDSSTVEKKQKIWDSLGKTEQRKCIQENIRNSIKTETTKNPRFILISKSWYEWIESYLLDIKSTKLYSVNGDTIVNIATGNSGIFFQYSNARGDCSGSIYLITKTGRYIEQINACAFGDSITIDSFELMTGLKINVHYDLGGIKKQKIISVKM